MIVKFYGSSLFLYGKIFLFFEPPISADPLYSGLIALIFKKKFIQHLLCISTVQNQSLTR